MSCVTSMASYRQQRQASAAPQPTRLSALQDRFARLGFRLHPLNGDTLLVERWGMTRTLPGLDAAAKFLRSVGGDHA